MTARVGIRDIVRNFNILENYEYVEIEDKKTHTPKGLFVSAELMDEVKKFLDEKILAEKQKKIALFEPFIGMVNGEFGELGTQEIKAMKNDRFND